MSIAMVDTRADPDAAGVFVVPGGPGAVRACPVLATGEQCLTLTVHPGAVRAGAVLARRHPAATQHGTITAHLPLSALGRDAQIVPRKAPLVVAPTALSSATTALLAALQGEPTSAAMRHILIQLTRGILANADPRLQAPLFADIRRCIDERLPRGGVAAGDVARDLGSTARQVRDVLATSEMTFAELVREARLSGLAEKIRTAPAQASLGELPREVGITSYPQAARAFKHRYGVTMRDYRSIVRMLRAPTSAAEDRERTPRPDPITPPRGKASP
jgi:AraC-like DNA-binding protein